MEINNYYNQLIMYYEIHRLRDEEGFSIRWIAKHLKMDFRTVKKYLHMSFEEFEQFLENKSERNHLLAPYEDFVKERLGAFPETSAAQMHDWLKERYPDFPAVPVRTVFNFVMWVRQKHNIPKPMCSERQFEEVLALPMGLQAQVDFGKTTLGRSDGGRQKVNFFAMTLSASRMKYLFLQTEPFTAHSAILAHEKAFAFFGGIPKQIVYDQDAVFLVDENIGDLVLVDAFRQYVASRPFKTYFCRKEDPQSKGKIENVVKYIKHNFLFNRTFTNIDVLNREALAWLGRTGNGQVHQKTRKVPKLVWLEERDTLQPYNPIEELAQPANAHKVMKTNVILYSGNTYSVPFGYYKGEETSVRLQEAEGMLLVRDMDGKLIATHKIPEGKGIQVFNTNHRRNNAESLKGVKDKFLTFFGHPMAKAYMEKLSDKYPRYLRDQLSAILRDTERIEHDVVIRALEFCMANNIVSANDFKSVLSGMEPGKTTPQINVPVKMMSSEASVLANSKPARSSIKTYESIFQSCES
jgi:hypothetical protein